MVLMFLDLSAWVFLAGVIAGEIYLFLVRGRPFWLRIAYFVVLLAVWIGYYYLLKSPTAAQLTYPRLFAWYLIYVHTVTMVVFATGLEFTTQSMSRYWPHVWLVILTLAIALAWPSFAVITHCRLLECF